MLPLSRMREGAGGGGVSGCVSTAESVSMRGQFRPIFRGRLAEDFFENPVKMCQRLEPDLERNLADPQVPIEKQVPGFLNAHARQIVGEIDAGYLLEQFAKIKCARVDGLCHLA